MRFYRQLQRGVYVMRLLPPFAVIKTMPQKVTWVSAAKLPEAPRPYKSSQRFSMQFGNEFLLFALGVQREFLAPPPPAAVVAAAVPIKLFVSAA